MGQNLEIDGDTIIHWVMADLSSGAVVNRANPGTYNLTINGSPSTIAGVNGDAIIFDATGKYGQATQDAGLTTILLGDCTLDCLVFKTPLAITTARQYIFSSAGSYAGDTEAVNSLISASINGNGSVAAFWESGAGTNRNDTNSANSYTGHGYWQHVRFVWSVSGGNRTVKVYVQGVLVHTFSAVTNATGGSTNAVLVARFAADNSGERFQGYIEEIRLKDVAENDAQALAAYERLFSSGGIGALAPGGSRFNAGFN